MSGFLFAAAARATPDGRVEALRVRFGARAAGWWRVAGDRLERVAFAAAGDLPGGVAGEFAEATRSVPMGEADLGIVRAAASGAAVVSAADDLPADSGSGLWLRRFGAARSVAVPVRDASGRVVGVVALALAGGSADDAEVAGAVRAEGEGWAGGRWD